MIDVRSGTSERALHQELIEGIPVGRIPNVAVMLVPGAVTARPDVGGSETGQTAGVSIHGSQTRDLVWNTDGLDMTSNTGSGGVSGQYPNQGAYQEIVVQTKALPAEIGAGGVSVNMITKDGGNRFRGDLFGTFTNSSLQADNVSDEQRERGLVAPSATDVFYDLNAERRRPGRARPSVVLRQRAALPGGSLRGQHVQSRRVAGARREPDLEHDRAS